MKKSIICLIVLALFAIPASAMAAKAVDIELKGYVKLHTWWDSAFVHKNLLTPIARANDLNAHHGRFRATAQSSRFAFAIKGPKIWGAKSSAYIEMDFDGDGDVNRGVTNAYRPRLRHAFFRLNFAQTEILMGQYWGMWANLYPETVQDGPLMFHGQPTQRLPQIRVTFKTGPWSFAALMGKPYDPGDGDQLGNAAFWGDFTGPTGVTATIDTSANQTWGQRAETPQFQFSVVFEKDLYGKAAFYGRPRGLYAQIAFGWQRTRYPRGFINGGRTWGQNNFAAVANFGGFVNALQRDNQTLDPWYLQGQVFIPIIPTRTPSLAGTASVSINMYVGQGISAFGNGRDQDNSYFQLNSFTPQWIPNAAGATIFNPVTPSYLRKLQKRWGGYIQAQYYFNNAWFISYLFGWSKAFDVDMDRNAFLPIASGGTNPNGYTYMTLQDQFKGWTEHNLTLFYRPVKALKFGLAYAYSRTDWFQITTVGSRRTNVGDAHRVQFAGWFFF